MNNQNINLERKIEDTNISFITNISFNTNGVKDAVRMKRAYWDTAY